MAAQQSEAPTGPSFTGVHHVNFTVTDLERSVAWYVETLGLTKGWEKSDEERGDRKCALLHPSLSFRLVLSLHRSGSGDAFSEFRTGLDHLAFTVADREELTTWEQHFDALGVEHSPIKEGVTGWLIVFRDPDNLQLEIYTQSK